MEQSTVASSAALEYRRADGEAREPASVPWLVAAVVLAMIPVLAMVRSSVPLEFRITTILLGVGGSAACALIALRVLRVRWWAIALLALCVLLSASASIASVFEKQLSRGNRQTILVLDIAHALPVAGLVSGFAWIGALALVYRLRGASFQSRRAKRAVMPLLILAWLGLSLDNSLRYAATMMFGGSVVARCASPDARRLAVVQCDPFLDTSYDVTLQGNSVFALTARRFGGPCFDGAGPLGAPSITWSADSRVIELRFGNDEPCFRYDTVAERELPAKAYSADGRQY